MTNEQDPFCFVQISCPGDASSWKQTVRAHAARNTVARQKRVVYHQTTKKVKDGRNKGQHQKQGNGSKEWSSSSSTLTSSAANAKNRVGQDAGAARRLGMRSQGFSRILGSARSDPFDTLVRKTSSFENYLLDHFIVSVVSASMTCLPFPSAAAEAIFRRGLSSYWIQTAITDAGMLASVFLASCRHLTQVYNLDTYTTLALQYRGECLASLNAAISKEGAAGVSDLTITKTLALASDATMTGDHKDSARHLEAAQSMLKARGGTQNFQPGEFLLNMVIWFVKDPVIDAPTILTPGCVASISKAAAVGVNRWSEIVGIPVSERLHT